MPSDRKLKEARSRDWNRANAIVALKEPTHSDVWWVRTFVKKVQAWPMSEGEAELATVRFADWLAQHPEPAPALSRDELLLRGRLDRERAKLARLPLQSRAFGKTLERIRHLERMIGGVE